MKKMITLSLAAVMSTATLGLATPAAAQQGYYDRDGYSSYYAGYGRDNRRYDRYDRRDYRNDRRDATGSIRIAGAEISDRDVSDRMAAGVEDGRASCRERVCQYV